MKKSNSTFLILTLFLASCATTHPGKFGAAVGSSDLPLKISAKTIDSKKEQAFQLVEFTLENTSDDWLKINNSQVLIPNPAESHLSVVLGQDLVSWAEAMQFQQSQDQYNKDLIRTGLLGVGAVSVVVPGSKDTKTAGAVLTLGSVGWAAYDVITSARQKVNGVEKNPTTHLYEPMSIPGKMYLRRWVLINKPSGTMLSTVSVQIENINGGKGVYEIPL